MKAHKTVPESDVLDTGLRSASSLSAGLKNGEFSSEELLMHFVKRFEQINPSVNAVVSTNIEQAIEQARASDVRRAKGAALGPLDGLPMTVKDAFQVKGLTATAGDPEMKDYLPTENAVEVQRLVDAGVVIYGKTNIPFLTAGFETYNDLYGTTNNPWDNSRTVGGSSGGAACAVATGMTSFEIGSDLGGSIRIPAHFCGVFGHKSSFGITTTRGHIPGPPGTAAETDMASTGPLARSAADLALVFSTMAGPDKLEAKGWRLDLPAPRHKKLEDYRVAAWLEDPNTQTDDAVREKLEDTVMQLEKAGVKVTRTRPDTDITVVFNTYIDLVSSILGGSLDQDLRDTIAAVNSASDPNDNSVNARWQRGLLLSHAQWLAAHETRMRLRYAWSDFFNQYDVLLTPPYAVSAFKHNQQDHGGEFTKPVIPVNGIDEPYLAQFFWSGFVNLLGLPGTVVPTGLSKAGLPVGLQIVGNYLDDLKTLKFAELTEEVCGGFVAPPNV